MQEGGGDVGVAGDGEDGFEAGRGSRGVGGGGWGGRTGGRGVHGHGVDFVRQQVDLVFFAELHEFDEGLAGVGTAEGVMGMAE